VDGDSPGGGEAAPLEQLTEPESLPEAVDESCARCHGVSGQGRGLGAFPKLAGQSAAYLESSLAAFQSGDRNSGMMEPLAAGLSREEIRQLAEYYAALDPPESAAADEGAAESIERGETIAQHGIPDQRVPACVDCHGPSDQPRNAGYPGLSGQYAQYIRLQLELFKAGTRGSTKYDHIMRNVASGLKPEQMRDVARYYASLSGAGGG
jgi:cytochrome c553